MTSWLLTLLAPAALGAPQLQLNSPPHGAMFDVNSAAYDPATSSVSVVGRIAGIAPQPMPAGYAIFINGHEALTAPGATTGIDYGDDVAMGPAAPWWWTNPGWPHFVPYRSEMIDDRRMYHPILAEVASRTTGQVFARRRNVVLDARADEDLTYAGPGSLQVVGAMSQLTPNGLAALQPVHEASLPYPSLAGYNGDLQRRATAWPRESSRPDDACFDIGDDLRFAALPAYGTALALAQAQKLVYDGLLATGTPQALLAASLMCVQTQPQPQDFEVCVGQLDATPATLSIASLDAATLTFGQVDGSFASQVSLNDPEAAFRLDLSNLKIQYALGGPLCGLGPDALEPRPSAAVTQNTIDTTPWLGTWTTCRNTTLFDDLAASVIPWGFVASPDGELLDTQQSTTSSFQMLTADIEPTGTCDLDFLRSESRSLVSRYLSDTIDALNGAWNDTQSQAQALDLLLTGFELGTCPVDGLDTTLTVTDVFQDPNEGMGITWSSSLAETANVSLTPSLAVERPVEDFLGLPPGNPWFWSDDGKDAAGQVDFDLSYAVQLNQLNHWIATKARGEAFAGDVTFSYATFGVTPPAGVSPNDPMPLTGNLLAPFVPPLGRSGNREIQFRVRPTLPPFLWMPRDVAPPETVSMIPITFQLADMQLDIVEIAQNGSERVLTTIAFDMYDPDVHLALPATPGDKTLEVSFSSPQWTFTVLNNGFATCPSVLHVNLPAFAGSCERQLENVVGAAFRPIFEERARQLLEDVPVPAYFDADGQSARDVQLEELSRVQSRGSLTIWGKLQ